jgi:hypothetical protein
MNPTDHTFHPKREWWTRCLFCNLSEAAHDRTSVVRRPE